jgi:hypothetical protein
MHALLVHPTLEGFCVCVGGLADGWCLLEVVSIRCADTHDKLKHSTFAAYSLSHCLFEQKWMAPYALNHVSPNGSKSPPYIDVVLCMRHCKILIGLTMHESELCRWFVICGSWFYRHIMATLDFLGLAAHEQSMTPNPTVKKKKMLSPYRRVPALRAFRRDQDSN